MTTDPTPTGLACVLAVAEILKREAARKATGAPHA
jgi:hypothetical protein